MMSDRSIRPGRSRSASGFSLVDVVIALSVLSIGILGVISLMIALKARNETFNTSRHAVRACQEVMELALAESQVMTLPAWANKWDRQTFQPRKVFALDKVKSDATTPGLADANTYVGRVSVRDVSDPALPGSLYEIAVAVDTTGLTPEPIKTSLVTRRSRP
jgi:Tfp pilus assembly protein PilV